MYKNKSQKQPKLRLSPGPANIQHIDETSKPVQFGMNQQSPVLESQQVNLQILISLSNAFVKKTRVLRMPSKQSGEILRHIYVSSCILADQISVSIYFSMIIFPLVIWEIQSKRQKNSFSKRLNILLCEQYGHCYSGNNSSFGPIRFHFSGSYSELRFIY